MRPVRPLLINTTWPLRRCYSDARGLYRVFNAPEYRFYRSNATPPLESDTPFATNATLPHEPSDLYGDGTWFVSVSFFNGVIDSGFLPLGPAGETYIRIDLSGGQQINGPPAGPADWQLIPQPLLGARVIAVYLQQGSLRATEWAITFTTTGSDPGTPPAVAPDITVTIPPGGVAVLSQDLTGGANAIRARLQTRRNDGSGWIYSENSVIKGPPAAPLGGTSDTTKPQVADRFPGRLPENL